MPVVMKCPHCATSLSIPSKKANVDFACPRCNRLVVASSVPVELPIEAIDRSSDPPIVSQPTKLNGESLLTCPDCGKQVSAKATVCPHCGSPRESISPAAKWIIGILGGIGLGLIVLYFL